MTLFSLEGCYQYCKGTFFKVEMYIFYPQMEMYRRFETATLIISFIIYSLFIIYLTTLISNWDYVEPNKWIVVTWKSCGKKWPSPNFRHYSSIWGTEGLRITTKNLSIISVREKSEQGPCPIELRSITAWVILLGTVKIHITLKMEALCYTRTLIPIYKATRCHNPHDHNINLHCRRNW
jgi:hypothetical protein